MSEDIDNDALTPIRFHFYSLKFTPYKGVNKSSNTILSDVITYIMKENANNKGYLIDRHKERDGEESRELFAIGAVFMAKERRVRFTLALLRGGQKPMLKPKDKFLLVPLDTAQGSIAEQTHVFIDHSKNYAVMCIAYNHHGPRVSDIEYYLRSIARDKLKLARATETELFMDVSVDKALAQLKNVLNIDIKVQPQKLAKLDTALVGQYFSGITSFGQRIKPKFIKLEALFQTPGNTVKSSEINKEAVGMVKDFMNKFKAQPINIDVFESFVVKYEDENGKEDVFNLLKGKKEIVKEIDLKTITKARQWYELIEKDFDEFIQSI